VVTNIDNSFQNSQLLPEMEAVWQKTLGWEPNNSQKLQFECLYELILAANQHLNLTRITAPADFWEKHLWDSLRGLSRWSSIETPLPWQAIDIGTGAGFPGLPIAIAKPDWQVTLLDSTRKKVAFLDQLIPQLAIGNATTVTGRAEEIGQQPQHRESYDLAAIRAVTSAPICAEYALPLLKLGGLALLYRGEWTDEETEALESVLNQLGGIIESVDRFTTPLSHSCRTNIYLRKVAPTPINSKSKGKRRKPSSTSILN
jgi:16S rRNA (guanine527-N7)-methyltransferase